MKLVARYIGIVLAALVLAGCGQKGPLYLPGDPSEVQTELPEIDRESLPGGDEDDDAKPRGDTPDDEH